MSASDTANTLSLADVTPGFRDAVHGAQQTYRALLDAMARPGTIVTLPSSAIAGIAPPRPMGIGAAAVLLTLLDAETTVALVGGCDTRAAEGYLRFHTGTPTTAQIAHADFVLVNGHELDVPTWSRLRTGSDEAPQDGATLIVIVDRLAGDASTAAAARLVLRGPGIADTASLTVGGLPIAFWTWRIALETRSPCGIDLVIVQGDRLAAIPRSTRIAFDEGSR